MTGLDALRSEWERGPDSLRRLRRGLDARTALALDRAQAELRDEVVRRLGPSYDLATLVEEYRSADLWARDLVVRTMAPLRLPAAVSPLLAAVFLTAFRAARDRA